MRAKSAMISSFEKIDIGSCMTHLQMLLGDGVPTKIEELLQGWQAGKGKVLLVADSEIVKLGLNVAAKKLGPDKL